MRPVVSDTGGRIDLILGGPFSSIVKRDARPKRMLGELNKEFRDRGLQVTGVRVERNGIAIRAERRAEPA